MERIREIFPENAFGDGWGHCCNDGALWNAARFQKRILLLLRISSHQQQEGISDGLPTAQFPIVWDTQGSLHGEGSPHATYA